MLHTRSIGSVQWIDSTIRQIDEPRVEQRSRTATTSALAHKQVAHKNNDRHLQFKFHEAHAKIAYDTEESLNSIDQSRSRLHA